MEKSNRELLEDLGIDIHRIRGNSGKVKCPKCSEDRKKKNDTSLSVDIEKGIYKCHHCQWSGKVYNKSKFEKEKRDYVRPPFVNNTDVSEKMVNWFFKRGISQKTISENRLSSGTEWMPQTQKHENTIQFNYFRGGSLINIKYRDGAKNFKMFKDAELIFYGLDHIKDSDWCVIVEGEMDKLAYWEAGIKEVISVPNGASMSENANLDYLDNCIEYFDNKTKIIIATDNDGPGIRLRDELARRLGNYRCYKVDLLGEKDANDFLIKNGSKKLKETVSSESIREFPLAGIISFKSIGDDIRDVIKSGGLQKGLTLGMKGLDDLISWVEGQFTVVTGIPNHGKSPFVLHLMLMLSIKHGWKWGIFTPEHKPPKIFGTKIIEIIAGKFSRTTRISDYEIDVALNFLDEHFFFIFPDENNKLDNILDKAKSLVIKKGIKGLVIDPWNKLEYEQPAGMSETNFISQQLDKIIDFNQNHGVHTIVVAHPTKGKKKGIADDAEYVVPDLTDISGSANWHNKPDNGIVFYRNFSEKRNEVYVKKVKWEHLGRQGRFFMKYNLNNGRFCHIDEDFDNSNWLIPEARQQELFSEPNVDTFANTPPDMEDSPF